MHLVSRRKYQSDIIYLLVSDGEGNVMNANIMASKWLVLLRASVKPLSINVNFLDLTDPWESIECFQVFRKSLYLFLLANLNCFPGSYWFYLNSSHDKRNEPRTKFTAGPFNELANDWNKNCALQVFTIKQRYARMPSKVWGNIMIKIHSLVFNGFVLIHQIIFETN